MQSPESQWHRDFGDIRIIDQQPELPAAKRQTAWISTNIGLND